ncbi:MAG: DUF2933 domain-containing protein [Gemmatimonadales bacterium]|nr:DUF2933 domain-containing protein [Gemmatimonadales bacterium]
MNWLRENWFWIVVGVFFLWSHGKMHGGHGGHSGHGGPRKDPRDRKDPGDQGDPHAQH